MSKRMKEASKVASENLYKVEDGIAVLKKFPKAKFDETVEVHVRLGIDPKQGDQIIRGAVAMPHGLGKSRKVAVVAKGEKVKEAEAAGADTAGSDDLIEKIAKGWMDFDVLVATPDAMKDLAKVGKTLGPKGLMPNPKTGTVTFDIAKTVKELKAGRVEYKNDAYGIIHAAVGKLSFDEAKLADNIKALMDAIVRAKPSTAKGVYLKSVTIASTMSPGVKLDPAQKF
ncbi:MAG: 50S ribosomal protein L1 [Elusimicrobia bacterium HGW-Elusimicrobia-1]|nr:MAG: 50S ribosomal protein L1 [Elusimicrobia bacterium HGW-Elusimicrobia-1]